MDDRQITWSQLKVRRAEKQKAARLYAVAALVVAAFALCIVAAVLLDLAW